MNTNILNLGEFLQNIEKFSWADQVFVSRRPLQSHSLCLIINTDDLEDPASDPTEALEKDLNFIAQVSTIQDVVRGFKSENSRPSDEELISRLESYLDHDA